MREYLIKEDDHEIVADAEIRLVEFVWHVEPEALEFSSLQENGVEPRQREEQLAIAERLATPVELLLRTLNRALGVTAKVLIFTDRLNCCCARENCACELLYRSVEVLSAKCYGGNRSRDDSGLIDTTLWEYRKWKCWKIWRRSRGTLARQKTLNKATPPCTIPFDGERKKI